ncbi:unknown [Coraliomargarita sp. CAG:312]|nr:unknown [Coraliomargarita sp. CAG:312]
MAWKHNLWRYLANPAQIFNAEISKRHHYFRIVSLGRLGEFGSFVRPQFVAGVVRPKKVASKKVIILN